ncbi:hypothetical protein JMJ77_0012886 [Colletotrichum scovillei]|uniref:Uncharacterized protein n=1 Tax=Colletotrichum scovillei TaxID=1209932 RepID=A0A9P7UC70_9PEZI|nr:hypothetical protein JMJ77_0012886 [Colletotrichum scovillei]KAG7069172.1 hypothetical protein JMJ76_0002847 [Colletotrichum scovillei]KAG7073122.1 hypothetical protein JMJ78_0014102 [Colletotrichum scovillei]
MRSHNATGQSLEPLTSTSQLHLMEESGLWKFPKHCLKKTLTWLAHWQLRASQSTKSEQVRQS